MFVEAVAGIALEKAWDNRATISSFAKDVLNLITKGELNIYVFGCGGTGKSTFGSIMEGDLEVGSITGEYELTSDVEYKNIKGRRFTKISVPPGQESYRISHWPDLFRDMYDSRRAIIFNMVSWGYHSVRRTELKNIEFLREGIGDESKNLFLEDNRKDEIVALSYLVDHISLYEKKLYVLTVVTMQDLWWHDRDIVRRHYQCRADNSDKTCYVDEIERLRKIKGMANFSHNFTSVSFGNINFRTSDGVVVEETAAGYEASLLHANFASFMGIVRRLTS